MSDPSIKNFTITYTALGNSQLPANINSSPTSNCCSGCFPYPFISTVSLTNLYGSTIQALNNETILFVLNSGKYYNAKINSIEVNLSGTHYYDCSEGSDVLLQFGTNPNDPPVQSGTFQDNPGGLISGTSNVIIDLTLLDPPILNSYTLTLSTFGQNCCLYSYILSLTFTVNIQVGICQGVALNLPSCTNFCTANTQNAQDPYCLTSYKEFCLANDSTGTPNIFGNTGCQTFFTNYIQNVKTDPDVDNALNVYCQRTYSEGFEQLLSTKDSTIIDLCGCHLDDVYYQNFRNLLIKEFPGYSLVAGSEVEQCLFPYCVDSPYKTVATNQTCPVPNCINLISINNSGTIGTIKAEQGNTGCANIIGGTGPTGGNGGNLPPATQSWWDKYWVYVILGIGILVVLIIAILIIIAAEKKGRTIKYIR